MDWQDEGYLLSKNNFSENSIMIEAFTLCHGRYNGIVYGGSSRKQKKYFQIGNKIFLNWKSKGSNRPGYFNIELIKPVSPFYFDDKKRTLCILSSASILKILLPERQTNKIIYNSFELLLNSLNNSNWISLYIYWELSLIKELGYEINFSHLNKTIVLNDKSLTVPNLLLGKDITDNYNYEIKQALNFNKSLLIENFITPNKLKFPLFRNTLESCYN